MRCKKAQGGTMKINSSLDAFDKLRLEGEKGRGLQGKEKNFKQFTFVELLTRVFRRQASHKGNMNE